MDRRSQSQMCSSCWCYHVNTEQNLWGAAWWTCNIKNSVKRRSNLLSADGDYIYSLVWSNVGGHSTASSWSPGQVSKHGCSSTSEWIQKMKTHLSEVVWSDIQTPWLHPGGEWWTWRIHFNTDGKTKSWCFLRHVSQLWQRLDDVDLQAVTKTTRPRVRVSSTGWLDWEMLLMEGRWLRWSRLLVVMTPGEELQSCPSRRGPPGRAGGEGDGWMDGFKGTFYFCVNH